MGQIAVSIAVLCNCCGHKLQREYPVPAGSRKEAWFKIAREYLARDGWRSYEDRDYCSACPVSAVTDQQAQLRACHRPNAEEPEANED